MYSAYNKISSALISLLAVGGGDKIEKGSIGPLCFYHDRSG